MEGLHEAGVDLIVTPYRGRPIEAPWWRTEPNPCYREGEIFVGSRDAVARAMGDTHFRRDEEHPPDGTMDKLVRAGDLALGHARVGGAMSSGSSCGSATLTPWSCSACR